MSKRNRRNQQQDTPTILDELIDTQDTKQLEPTPELVEETVVVEVDEPVVEPTPTPQPAPEPPKKPVAVEPEWTDEMVMARPYTAPMPVVARLHASLADELARLKKEPKTGDVATRMFKLQDSLSTLMMSMRYNVGKRATEGNWRDIDITHYALTRNEPKRHKYGTIVGDKRHFSTPIDVWSPSTLYDMCIHDRTRAIVDATRTRLSAVHKDNAFLHCIVEDLVEFLSNDTPIAKTSRGNVVNSAQREAYDKVEQWSKTELMDFITGELVNSSKVPTKELEVYARVAVSGSAKHSLKAVQEHLVKDKPYTYLEDGIAVYDEQRAHTHPLFWSLEELVLYAKGVLPESTNFTKEDIIQAIKERFYMTNVNEDQVIPKAADIKEVVVNPDVDFVRNGLKQFAQRMNANTNVTEDAAGSALSDLYNVLRRLVSLDFPNFHEGWTLVLNFAADERAGLFAESRAFRGLSTISGSAEKIGAIEQLVWLIMNTCIAETRTENYKGMSLDALYDNLAVPAARENIAQYYNM